MEVIGSGLYVNTIFYAVVDGVSNLVIQIVTVIKWLKQTFFLDINEVSQTSDNDEIGSPHLKC